MFLALVLELILKDIGINGSYLPNFIMCIVFSFAFHKKLPIWLVSIAVILGESFFSTTPVLMTLLILLGYVFIAKLIPKRDLKQRNFHIIIFMLICLVIYSTKILWLFVNDHRPEVSLMIIKMLVTIILFPLFYIFIGKFLRLV